MRLLPCVPHHRTGGRRVTKPGAYYTFRHPAPPLDEVALPPRALPALPYKCEGGKQSAVHQHGVANDQQVTPGNGDEQAQAGSQRGIFPAHEEAVLDRMPVDYQRQLAKALGGNAALVPAYRRRHVQAVPAQQLRPPGQVGVFAVSEEVFVEELSLHRDILYHGPPVQGSGSGGAKDILRLLVLPAVNLLTAAVEMAQVAGEVDAGGINAGGKLRLATGIPAQQLPAERADPAIRGLSRGQQL